MANTMHFRNFGGIHQFVVADEGDLARIDALDPARWAATSAPLADLHCDPAFLGYLDAAGTGRIRVAQLIAAREFLFERLARRGKLKERSEVLVLDDLATGEAGSKLRAAAEQLIAELKLESHSQITLANVRAFRDSYRTTLANGDGVVPAEYVPEPEVAAFIKELLATTGGTADAGGLQGAGQAELDRFVERARAYLEWRGQAAAAAAWGADTEAAAGAVAGLDAKIEEYFWHCDLLRQEGGSAEALRLKEDELKALSAQEAASIEKYLAGSPLALPTAAGAIPLGQPVNPVYRDAFEELRTRVLARALPPGTAQLTRAQWRQVKATFDGYFAWQKAKPPEPFDALGEERVKALVEGPLPARLLHFISVDKAAAPALEQVSQLEQLILYQRWLIELVNNFVNFSAIYRPSEQALIEVGSMVIDGRRLDFCIKVADRAAHKAVASQSLIYLVYAHILEKDGSAPAYEVMAPVTGGERGRLRVGKRGIFIDTTGKEWDALITEIVENPISLWEATLAPFRRAQQFLGKKIQDLVGAQQQAQEKAMIASAERGVTEAEKAGADAAAGKAPPPPAPPEKKGEGLNINSLVVGGGLALAGLGAVLAGLIGILTSLTGWAAILGVVGAVMAISALLGWLKLRKRDMSLVLEASGWAVNIQMNINRRIARLFTFTPALPAGSVKERLDELRTKEDEGGGGIWVLLFVVVVIASLAAYYFRRRLFHVP